MTKPYSIRRMRRAVLLALVEARWAGRYTGWLTQEEIYEAAYPGNKARKLKVATIISMVKKARGCPPIESGRPKGMHPARNVSIQYRLARRADGPLLQEALADLKKREFQDALATLGLARMPPNWKVLHSKYRQAMAQAGEKKGKIWVDKRAKINGAFMLLRELINEPPPSRQSSPPGRSPMSLRYERLRLATG